MHVLINTAGVGAGMRGRQLRQMSEDGYELRFDVNHLAPFMLTHLLVPAHPQAYDARARQRLWEVSEELTGLAGKPLG